MTFKFAHNNINVINLEKSLAFYQEALGLTVARRVERSGYTLVFLTDGITDHRLELTCLDHYDKPAYDLGDNEIHLAFTVDDMAAARAKHAAMGCICHENEAIGIYFIADPDGYWTEIIPEKR